MAPRVRAPKWERGCKLTITLPDTLAAISLLLNTESCSRVSGTAAIKSWGKGDFSGPPKRVQTVQFVVDNISGSWSQIDERYGEGFRYSREFGHEFVDNGDVVDYLSGLTNWPTQIKMFRPSKFEIWGRPDDKWRIAGAEVAENGYLLHLDRSISQAVAELFIDTTFSLPTHWTEIYPIGDNVGAKKEIEIQAIHVPVAWKEKMGMDMSEEGEDRISFMVNEFPESR